MARGIADEGTMDDLDKGPLTYQESKVFCSETHLCSVYDSTKKRCMTFEVYGLDSQNMLHTQYSYNDFDGLFRFNAELMNPNRKEGRFHWVIQRLEIAKVAGEQKLRLGNECTKEVPELPIYETVRKIPTGRMDLKERQRLREQMDMLDIKRDENIAARRAKSKARFLKHIFLMKEEAERRRKEVEVKIAQERDRRANQKDEMEQKEAEEIALMREKANARIQRVDVKEQIHEKSEEDDLRQLRIRWKAADAEKAKLIVEARQRQAKQHAAQKEAARLLAQHRAQAEEQRCHIIALREARIQKHNEDAVAKALALIPVRQREANLSRERNQEFVKDLEAARSPIFEGYLERCVERQQERESEQQALENYVEGRALPKKEKKKGKKKAAKGSKKEGEEDKITKKSKKAKGEKDAENTEDDGGGEVAKDKKGAERLIDAVELKMRQDMEEQKRRRKLEKQREQKIETRRESRLATELERIAAYKEEVRQRQAMVDEQAAARRVIIQQRDLEALCAKERKAQEMERLRRVREANIARVHERRIEKIGARTA